MTYFNSTQLLFSADRDIGLLSQSIVNIVCIHNQQSNQSD